MYVQVCRIILFLEEYWQKTFLYFMLPILLLYIFFFIHQDFDFLSGFEIVNISGFHCFLWIFT